MSKTKMAYWKDSIESGVKVKPRSLNIDAGVKTPLSSIREVRRYFSALRIEHTTTRD